MDTIKKILSWFKNLFSKHTEPEQDIPVLKDWNDIVETMKLYEIDENDIIVGKEIYTISYTENKKDKTVTFEYPITYDGEKFIYHRDLKHNITLGKKTKVTNVESYTYRGWRFWSLMSQRLGVKFILEKILELNNLS